jgi:uncharacterized protein (UPF0276 family)
MRTRDTAERLHQAAWDLYRRVWRQTPCDPLVIELDEALAASRAELDAEAGALEPANAEGGAA